MPRPSKEPDQGTLGYELKKARKRRGLSQGAVGEVVGLTRQGYALYERNSRFDEHRFNPDPTVLIRLARFYGVPAAPWLRLAKVETEYWLTTSALSEPAAAGDRKDLLARLAELVPLCDDTRLRVLVEVAAQFAALAADDAPTGSGSATEAEPEQTASGAEGAREEEG